MFIVINLVDRENDLSVTKQYIEYFRAIIQSVELIPDLVSADKHYHFLCMKNVHIHLHSQGEVTKEGL